MILMVVNQHIIIFFGEEWKTFGDRLAIEGSTIWLCEAAGCRAHVRHGCESWELQEQRYRGAQPLGMGWGFQIGGYSEWDGHPVGTRAVFYYRTQNPNMRRAFTNKTFGAKRIPWNVNDYGSVLTPLIQ